MVQFGTPRDENAQLPDLHDVMRRDFINIVRKFREEGKHEQADFYQDYLDTKLNGEPSTLF